jgi:3',5'-cyclic-nucleotide phosphodiesterase
MNLKTFYTILFCHFLIIGNAQNTPSASGFKVIPLGVKGGLDETNLSAYLVSALGSSNFICLDAGTVYGGLQKVKLNHGLDEHPMEDMQKKMIKAYFISHGHLDHLAGLILNAPNDNAKPIYAFPSVIEVMKQNYFTWKSWANFANEGDQPILNKYQYQTLEAGKEIEVTNTSLQVTAFPLSHVNPYESSAFLIRNQQNYLLYLGDTGADSVEKSDKLSKLWQAIAPLIIKKQLKSIFIEVSFDNSIPKKSLFGHLTPQLLMQEMSKLNAIAGDHLKSVQIAVTHIKPCDHCEENIKKQIAEANHLGLKIIYPEQAVPLVF